MRRTLFGHVMRREGLEILLVTGMVEVTGMGEGSRGRGRPRGIYLIGFVKLAQGNMKGDYFIRAKK